MVSAAAFFRHAHDNINMRGAFWHLFSDALGSVGVIVAGVGVALFSAEWLDPAVSIAISLLVIAGAWQLLRDSGRVLLESVPANLDVAAVRDALAAEQGSRPSTIFTSGRPEAIRPRSRPTWCSAVRSASTTRSYARAS